jgi:hypothetical protein
MATAPLPLLAWLLAAGCPVDWSASLAAAEDNTRLDPVVRAWLGEHSMLHAATCAGELPRARFVTCDHRGCFQCVVAACKAGHLLQLPCCPHCRSGKPGGGCTGSSGDGARPCCEAARAGNVAWRVGHIRPEWAALPRRWCDGCGCGRPGDRRACAFVRRMEGTGALGGVACGSLSLQERASLLFHAVKLVLSRYGTCGGGLCGRRSAPDLSELRCKSRRALSSHNFAYTCISSSAPASTTGSHTSSPSSTPLPSASSTPAHHPKLARRTRMICSTHAPPVAVCSTHPQPLLALKFPALSSPAATRLHRALSRHTSRWAAPHVIRQTPVSCSARATQVSCSPATPLS